MGGVPTDEQLLAAADDDPDAFAAFYRRHAPALLAFCARRTGDPDAAADAVAETFALALEGCHRFRADRGSAAGWLYGIAKHVLARRAARGTVEARALRRLALERPPLDPATREALPGGEGLGEALAALPDPVRAVVVGRVVDEAPYAQLAAAHGTTEPAVRQRVSRGLAALRAHLTASRGALSVGTTHNAPLDELEQQLRDAHPRRHAARRRARVARAAAAAPAAGLAVLALGGGAAAVAALGDAEQAGPAGDAPTAAAPAPVPVGPAVAGPREEASRTLAPRSVAVLNGTTQPGLAAAVARFVPPRALGTIGNAATQGATRTRVQGDGGRGTVLVSALLGLQDLEPLDDAARAAAGPDAQVVVTVGRDARAWRTQLRTPSGRRVLGEAEVLQTGARRIVLLRGTLTPGRDYEVLAAGTGPRGTLVTRRIARFSLRGGGRVFEVQTPLPNLRALRVLVRRAGATRPTLSAPVAPPRMP